MPLTNAENAATDNQLAQGHRPKHSTAVYFWISLVCLCCILAWCTMAVIEGIPLGRLSSAEESHPTAVEIALAAGGVLGTLTCALLMTIDLAFNRRRITWGWSLASLSINGITAVILVTFHKTGHWLVSALQDW